MRAQAGEYDRIVRPGALSRLSMTKLCCMVNKDFECKFCHEVMCTECGKAWSENKHFILDMCRKRFTSLQLKKAAKCYADRVANQTARARHMPMTQLSDCYVCRAHKKRFAHDFEMDRLRYGQNKNLCV